MIIVIAITTISALMFSDINMSNALRYWRLIFLAFAAVSGLIGVFVITIIFITKIVSINSMDKAYTYPLSPVDRNMLTDFIKRDSMGKIKKRSNILTKNITKQK